jgi:hypothetical protein
VVLRDDHQTVEENYLLDGDSVGEFLLIRAGTAQETALLGNPLSALQMTQVCIPRTFRFAVRIDMQDYSCDFPPAGPLALGLQKARVRHDVLFVIGCQRRIGWRDS